ncbi:MAG: flagellar brake protein [Betaproteobacteria bacterium]|nr:MAG: flagellar brake protein [Betaproteobacteria bacterium]
MSSPDITARLSTSGQLLVRSGIEIGRILDAILEDHVTLTASLPPQLMFLSQLVYVEPVKGYMLLSYSYHKAANAAALTVPKLTFRCNHRGAQFAFPGTTPHAVVHTGKPCIQCELPTIMLAIQQRRAVNRVAVPAQAPVNLSDPTIPLCAGTRLERARIRHPQHEPIEVDLEVRYVTRVKLANGERASRIGCKILSSADNLEELIRLFIIDLQ